MLRVALLAWVLGVAVAFAAAQSTGARITGTVKDPSSGVVPGVSMILLNLETNQRWEATTSASGTYTIPFLEPGGYELAAEVPGFKRYVRKGIVLETGQVATIDIPLDLGEPADVVSVTAGNPVLETETSSVGQLIENKTIIDMPLASRRAAGLVRLMGGVIFLQEGSGGAGAEGVPFFSLGGGRTRNQMWYLDGAVAQNVALSVPQLGFNPPVEALQEFRIEANNYSAEHGRTSGGHLSLTTKSGTNQFHGAAYEYVRNDALDARPFFSPGVSPRRYNVFGATLGGPFRRDRTHFFFSYEGTRRRDGVTRTLNVPAPREVQGDFSDLPGQLLDPVTGAPFLGKLIPPTRLDPVGKQLAALYPAPNLPGRANNFVANAVNATTQDVVLARVDHQLSPKDRVHARYMHSGGPNDMGPVFPNAEADPFSNKTDNRQHLVSATWLRTLGRKWVHEVRYTYSTRSTEVEATGAGSNIVQRIGLRGVAEDGMPRINVAGLAPLGSMQHQRLLGPARTDQLIDSLSWLARSHAMKLGFEWRRSSLVDDFDSQKHGAFTFNDVATGRGFALAALLLGWVNQANVLDVDVTEARSDYFAVYLQDDWKVTPRLTLNLGLRWEMDTPRWEAIDNRQSGFDPQPVNPVAGVPGIVTFAGRGGRSKYAHEFDANNFGPRFGFAWRPRGEKTVVRGGFGIVFAGAYEITFVTPVGFGDSREFVSPDNGRTAAFLLRDGVPSQTREALGPGFGAARPGERVRLAPEFFQEQHRNPYSEMFNLGLQRELVGNLMVEVAYQGNLGHKVPGRSISINEIPPELRGAAPDQRRRPFPQFGNVTILSPTWGNSSYHALNAKVEKRFSRGFNFLANYTWSKFIDDVEALNELGGAPGATGLQGGGYQSFYNRRAEKALSGNDIAHRFVGSSVFELPVGKGKKLDLGHRFWNQLLGGWETGLIAELHTGPPFGVVEQTNRLNAFSPSQRPSLAGDPRLAHGRTRAEGLERWFDIDRFVFPGNGVAGNAGRSVGRGPGFASFELSLLKNWRWGENRFFQVRAEMFNLFNHPNFDLPNNERGNPSFGRISRTVNDGRSIQLGLKLTF